MSEMQLALESGQIDMLGTYQSVANYMLKNSPDKEILSSDKILSDSFCFAVRKGHSALKNDLNRAIKEMSVDGTLNLLSKKYITDLKDGAEPPAIERLTLTAVRGRRFLGCGAQRQQTYSRKH